MEHADLTPSDRRGLTRMRPWLRNNKPVVTHRAGPERDAIAIVRAALAPWAQHYRDTIPELARKIEWEREKRAMLGKPETRTTYTPPITFSGMVRECLRCGYPAPIYASTGRFCSPECSDEHRDWCRRTGRKPMQHASKTPYRDTF